MSSPERDDALVREAMQALAADDARTRSSYHDLLTRPSRVRPPRHRARVWRLAAAAAVLVAASLRYRAVCSRRNPITVPPDVVALTVWRPSTGVFLPSPSALTPGTPTLGTSILPHSPVIPRQQP